MKTGYFACATVGRWEWPFIREWVEYHRLIGAEHLFYYAHEQNHAFQKTASLLKPYVDSGFLTLTQINLRIALFSAFNDAVSRAKGKFKWLALHDVDEFLYPMQNSTVPEVLEKFEWSPAFCSNWRIFGTSGHWIRPRSQLKNLLYCSRVTDPPNGHVKCVVQPEFDPRFTSNPHLPEVETHNEKGERVLSPIHPCVPTLLRYNHYCVRSYQDYWEIKARRGFVDDAAKYGRVMNTAFLRDNDLNHVFDEGIARRFADFLPEEAYSCV